MPRLPCGCGQFASGVILLFCVHRSPSELAGYQEKTFVIDDHIGISISGLTADARYLCKYKHLGCFCIEAVRSPLKALLLPFARRFMRSEAINRRFVYDTPLQTATLVETVANSACVVLCPLTFPSALMLCWLLSSQSITSAHSSTLGVRLE